MDGPKANPNFIAAVQRTPARALTLVREPGHYQDAPPHGASRHDRCHRRTGPRHARAAEEVRLARRPRPGSTCPCRRGSSTASSGPNGAGKTTTMRLLTGLIHADAGTIELLGEPFGRRDRRRLFDVGALIERRASTRTSPARENLRALRRRGRPDDGQPDRGAARARRAQGAGQGTRSRTYSLGMKQRLGIAAALLSDPKLLLLDEPANGLDPAGIVAMRETLRYLASTGKTVFVSSHILGEVQQLADIIGIIAAGRLVREGPIEQLLQARASSGSGWRRTRSSGRRGAGRARAGRRQVTPERRRGRAGWRSRSSRTRRRGQPRARPRPASMPRGWKPAATSSRCSFS